jgi:hypothetical protein
VCVCVLVCVRARACAFVGVCVCNVASNLSSTVLCRYIWPAQFHHNFLHCLINGNNLGGKNLLNIKCDFILSKSCVCNISHAKKN